MKENDGKKLKEKHLHDEQITRQKRCRLASYANEIPTRPEDIL